MTLRRWFVALAVALALPTAAYAGTQTHKEAKVTFEVPDSWKTAADGDTLQITSPDGGCEIAFMVLPAEALEEALKKAGEEIEKAVKDLEPDGEPKEIQINGLDAFVADAKGKVDGKAVNVGIGVIKTKTDKVLMIFGISDASKNYDDDVGKLISSIKPTN